MEKTRSSFDKGLSTEFSKFKQPDGTYSNAENFVRDSQGTIKSEKGTTLLAQLTSFTNVKIIGEVSIEDDIIYFIVSDEGSTIMKLDSNNVATNILHTGSGAIVPDTEQTYLINVDTVPTPESIDVLVSSQFKYHFELTSNTEVTVSMIDILAPVDYIYTANPFTNDSSSIKLPEALRPKTTFSRRNDYFGAAENGSDVSLSVNTNGTVAMFQSGSYNTQKFYLAPFTYEAEGIVTSVIIEDVLAFSRDHHIDAQARKNYKGEIVIYFTDDLNIPRRLNTTDYVDLNNFDNTTKLFLNPNLPRIAGVSVSEGGGLTTGLYKFAARLGTADGNVTTFSQISQGIPVVDDGAAGGEAQYDGAPPQTPSGKSININISNIDTTYAFIEIAVITYLGEENLLSSHIVAKLNITSTGILFNYYSETQILEEVLLDALIQDSIEYSTAKNILQKDNHLFLSNLTTKDFSFIDDEMTEIANSITAHWFVKSEIQGPETTNKVIATDQFNVDEDWYQQGFLSHDGEGYMFDSLNVEVIPDTTFKNYNHPSYTYLYKGYQRDEVYSFAIVPIFKGGVYGTAYHIPGDITNPTDQGKEGQQGTDRLRGWVNSDGTVHHRMPSTEFTKAIDVNTLLVSDPPTIQVTFNILGVEFRNVDLQTTLLSPLLEGYVIVRQRRNRPGNGIVVTQGITKEFYEGKDGGLNPIPFNGKTSMYYDFALDWQGRSYWFGDLNRDPRVTNDISREGSFAVYSPDIIHGLVNSTHLGSMNSVKQIAIKRIQRVGDNGHDIPVGRTVPMLGVMYQDQEDLSYDNTDVDLSNLHVPKDLNNSAAIIVEPFQAESLRSINLNGETLKLTGTTGMAVMKMKTGTIPKERTKYPGVISISGGGGRENRTFGQTNGVSFDFDYNQTMQIETTGHWSYYLGNESMEIYNFYSFIGNIYGTLATAEYIAVEEVFFNNSPDTTIQVFGGDTFLSRYAFMIGEVGEIPGMNYRATIETYIETKGNYAFRHYEPTTYDGGDTIEGTMPYFPKYTVLHDREIEVSKVLGLWDFDTSHGSGTSYNKQYNFENTLNKYYPKDTFIASVSSFPNRIIYSLKSFENEQFDTYRTFLTNNFHDIPKETGEISNMFEYNNLLYAHTPHSLWRTFVNEKTFTNSTSGEIVLGNGGLFPMPSNQIFTEDGGYAGTGAKWACTNTPYGRVFMDDHQKKIFILGAKSGLVEISNPLMFSYFNDTLLINNSNTYQMGYDPLHKRVLVTLVTTGNTVGNSLSYSFELKSWTGFHSYGVDKFSQRDNKLLGAAGDRIEEIGTGPYNSYFGGTYSSKLSIVVNPATNISKDFTNLKWIQTNKGNIFKDIKVITDDFTTGSILPIIVTSFADEQSFLPLGQQHVHLIGGEHRMVIPPDNNPLGGYIDELFRPSIKGKYATIELEYTPDLVDNTPLELEYFSTEFLTVAE